MSSSSSSSSSNNPFVAEENNDNDNEQNKNKELEDTLKFLEEDASNIAPPPAYEDIEKPPPTLPGYNHNGQPINNDLSYPPPRAPSTENYNRPNFLPPPSTSSNFKRNGTAAFCCGSTRRQNCGCGWLVVLIIFVILTAVSVVNNNVCSKLTLGSNPETFSFDPTNTRLLRIAVDTTRIKRGDVRVFSGQPNQQQVEIQVLTGTNGVTPKFNTLTQNGIYELDITQTSGFSIFNIPPRCMKMQVNVYLPSYLQTAPTPNAIQVKDLNIILNQGFTYKQDITLITETGGILLNGVSAQNINLLSRDGNIVLNNATVNGIFNISTSDGDIRGDIYLSNALSVRSKDGDVDLDLNIADDANAKVGIVTDDGDVGLNFGNSFFGSYSIRSIDGAIRINSEITNDNIRTGSIGVGGSNLNINSNDGNIMVLF